jgi:hypothetical protein
MMTTAAELRSALDTSRARLFGTIRGLSEEQFRHVPGGASWCIATHLSHLLRIERVFLERARVALVEDEPTVPSTRTANDDDLGLAQRLAVPQVVHGMLNARRELLALLDRCGDDGLSRTILHERLGRMTVRDIAVKMAAHEEEHSQEVLSLARSAPPSGRVIIPLKQRS